MEVVNHLENSLERISTGNLYTPPSIHTATQTDTHTHVHALFATIFPPVLHMNENLQLLQKSYKQYLRNSTSYWAALLWHIVRKPNAMPALQWIYSNICKNIWGEEETNVPFQFQHSKETNGHRAFTNRKHRNK